MLASLSDPRSSYFNPVQATQVATQFGMENLGTWAGGIAMDAITSGAMCHPASSTLELADGRAVRIDSVRVGDEVRTPTGFEPVTGFLHAEDRATEYLRLTTAGGAAIEISALHHLFANGASADAADVVVGDNITTPRGAERVTRVEKVERAGAYHVFVAGGAYYVDGVLASDYYALTPAAVWPLVRAYVAARSAIGVPIIPVGRGLFPDHAWAVDLLGLLGVPTVVQRTALFPLTIACGIGTELINAAAELATSKAPAIALGTAAAAALATAAARKMMMKKKRRA